MLVAVDGCSKLLSHKYEDCHFYNRTRNARIIVFFYHAPLENIWKPLCRIVETKSPRLSLQEEIFLYLQFFSTTCEVFGQSCEKFSECKKKIKFSRGCLSKRNIFCVRHFLPGSVFLGETGRNGRMDVGYTVRYMDYELAGI